MTISFCLCVGVSRVCWLWRGSWHPSWCRWWRVPTWTGCWTTTATPWAAASTELRPDCMRFCRRTETSPTKTSTGWLANCIQHSELNMCLFCECLRREGWNNTEKHCYKSVDLLCSRWFVHRKHLLFFRTLSAAFRSNSTAAYKTCCLPQKMSSSIFFFFFFFCLCLLFWINK